MNPITPQQIDVHVATHRRDLAAALAAARKTSAALRHSNNNRKDTLMTTTTATARPRRPLMPAATLIMAGTAAALSIVAIVDDDVASSTATPPTATVARSDAEDHPGYGPVDPTTAVSIGDANQPTSVVTRAARVVVDACGRPIVRERPSCA